MFIFWLYSLSLLVLVRWQLLVLVSLSPSLDCIGLDWIGLDWIELDFLEVDLEKCECKHDDGIFNRTNDNNIILIFYSQSV